MSGCCIVELLEWLVKVILGVLYLLILCVFKVCRMYSVNVFIVSIIILLCII